MTDKDIINLRTALARATKNRGVGSPEHLEALHAYRMGRLLADINDLRATVVITDEDRMAVTVAMGGAA
jgi:hypothetical protein